MLPPATPDAAPPLRRRTLIRTGAVWGAPTVVAVAAAPAFAASVKASNYVALFDTQGANTNQNNTDVSTWPHGVITDAGEPQVKFQVGMEMMAYNRDLYDEVPYETYKNWTSGPITFKLTFDNTIYALLDKQSTWTDLPDNGGTAWRWTSTTTVGTQTTLTLTHDPIAFNGNSLGMPTQTGAFELLFTLLKNPGVQTAPSIQPANGRTVTSSMSVSVTSELPAAHIPYVQEDSKQLF